MKESVPIGRSGITKLHIKAMQERDLLTWTIYDHPLDFPDSYVVRPFSSKLACPLTVHFAHAQLDVVRGALERLGLTRLARSESDPPSVIETWI
jgi:hypothetical protein